MEKVRLSPMQLRVAKNVAKTQVVVSDNHGWVEKDYADIEDTLPKRIMGMKGECAAAKCLNVFWHMGINTFKEPDIGEGLQVRTRSADWHDLIVRDNDDLDQKYVLVIDHEPEYHVIGWIEGRDAQRDAYLKNPNGRKEAWFVPQADLRSIDELKEILKMRE